MQGSKIKQRCHEKPIKGNVSSFLWRVYWERFALDDVMRVWNCHVRSKARSYLALLLFSFTIVFFSTSYFTLFLFLEGKCLGQSFNLIFCIGSISFLNIEGRYINSWGTNYCMYWIFCVVTETPLLKGKV